MKCEHSANPETCDRRESCMYENYIPCPHLAALTPEKVREEILTLLWSLPITTYPSTTAGPYNGIDRGGLADKILSLIQPLIEQAKEEREEWACDYCRRLGWKEPD